MDIINFYAFEQIFTSLLTWKAESNIICVNDRWCLQNQYQAEGKTGLERPIIDSVLVDNTWLYWSRITPMMMQILQFYLLSNCDVAPY